MKLTKQSFAFLPFLLLPLAFASCGDDDPIEDAVDNVDDAIDDAADEIDDAIGD